MVIFFDKLYNNFIQEGQTNFFYKFIRVFIRIIYNLLIPLYYILFFLKKFISKNNFEESEPSLIISLTSFPDRIDKLWIVIVSLMKQDFKVDKIILWLSYNDFSSKSDLPKILVFLERFGLEIRFCNGNLLGHKKYLYSFKEYPTATIITVDDDIIYRPDMVSCLYNCSSFFPDTICANIGVEVVLSLDQIQTYSRWKPARNLVPSPFVCPIGAGGVLYPVRLFHSSLLDESAIKETSLKGDDLWLYVAAKYSQINAVSTSYSSSFLPIIYLRNTTLNKTNVIKGGNDTHLTNIIEFYKNKYEFNLINYLTNEEKSMSCY